MFKKILLLICVAFVVVCYAYPCFILPFGSYSGEYGTGDSKVEVSYKFNINGKVKIKNGALEVERYYKLDGTNIIISDNTTFDEEDAKIALSSMYSFDTSDSGIKLTNDVGMYVAIGFGALAVLLICLPSKR